MIFSIAIFSYSLFRFSKLSIVTHNMEIGFLLIWKMKSYTYNVIFTGRIQSERQQALEKMGISVQASGIKVEKNKYYLVNLNADPSLNELLVYYLKVSS